MAKSSDKSLKGKFVLNRDRILTTTLGHSIRFKKGVPTHVPPAAVREAMNIGALPADGNEDVVTEPDTGTKEPIDPVERQEQIMGGILKLIERNRRGDFTAANNPSPAAVSEMLGYKVESKEIGPVWQRYHEEKAEAETASRLASENEDESENS